MATFDNNLFTKTALQAALGGASKSADFVTLPSSALADGDIFEGAVRLALTGTGAAGVGVSVLNHPGLLNLDAPAGADAAFVRVDPVSFNAATQSLSATAVLNVTVISGDDIGCGLALRQLAPLGTVGADRLQIVASPATGTWYVEIDDGAALLVSTPVAAFATGTWYRLGISVVLGRVEFSIDGEVVYVSTNQPFNSAGISCGAFSGTDTATLDLDLITYALTGLGR